MGHGTWDKSVMLTPYKVQGVLNPGSDLCDANSVPGHKTTRPSHEFLDGPYQVCGEPPVQLSSKTCP